MTFKINFGNNLYALLIFVIASFAIYFPIIHNSFVSDDFQVIRRVALDNILFAPGFFRPLSDLTIYFNYLLGGFNPIGYNIFGILLHGLNCFLLYIFCVQWKWTSDESLQRRYALLAAILFLCYPFHNESIVWTLGRGSSMANGFCMLALVILTGSLNEGLKILLCCFCFFIGLTAYESIVIFPVMVWIILYKRNSSWRRIVNWTLALGLTLVLHLLIRIKLSGVFVGEYGEGFFLADGLHFASNIFKVAARLFLPPIESSFSFTIAASFLVFFLGIFTVLVWGRIVDKSYFIKILALICIASTVSVLASVSTKTSESDRFLHLPSFFVCCFLSFVLINSITQLNKLWLASLLICLYFTYYLEKNNSNWIKASNIADNIISTIKENVNHQKLWIVNLPDEFNGAFIFRMGLKDALLINKIDTTNIVIINNIKREQMRLLPAIIVPVKQGNVTTIPPNVTINESSLKPDFAHVANTEITVSPHVGYTLLYWNNQKLVKLKD
jgi:hypothetical protein